MVSLRKLVGCVLVLVIPASVFAADSAAAMLYTNGTAWLNGSNVPRSSAVFEGDLVQTKSNSLANLRYDRSNVIVLSDSLVQVLKNAVKLEHGTVTVATSTKAATQVGDLKIAPASSSWTQFKVADTDGTIRISAEKGNLSLSDGTTVPEGQETSRDEIDQNKKKRRGAAGTGAVPAAGGGILNSPIAIGTGAAVVGGLVTWVLIQGDDPLSPVDPSKRNGR